MVRSLLCTEKISSGDVLEFVVSDQLIALSSFATARTTLEDHEVNKERLPRTYTIYGFDFDFFVSILPTLILKIF